MKLVDPKKHWYVVRTNIKCEYKAASNIRAAGFDVYLPTQRVEKKHRRTNTYSEVERPLMLRYLFVGFYPTAKHFGFVRACEGVERLLESMGEPIPVPGPAVAEIQTAEIDLTFDDTRRARIHRKEEEKTKKLTLEKKYKPGAYVLIEDEKNPFHRFTAIVDEVTKTGNVKVLVSLFGRATPLEMEASHLLVA